jgi:hypothetical protein
MALDSARFDTSERFSTPVAALDALTMFREVTRPFRARVRMEPPRRYGGRQGGSDRTSAEYAAMYDLQGRMHQWYTSFDVLEEAGVLVTPSTGLTAWLAMRQTVVQAEDGSGESLGAPHAVVLNGRTAQRTSLCPFDVFDLSATPRCLAVTVAMHKLFMLLTDGDAGATYRYYYVVRGAAKRKWLSDP